MTEWPTVELPRVSGFLRLRFVNRNADELSPHTHNWLFFRETLLHHKRGVFPAPQLLHWPWTTALVLLKDYDA